MLNLSFCKKVILSTTCSSITYYVGSISGKNPYYNDIQIYSNIVTPSLQIRRYISFNIARCITHRRNEQLETPHMFEAYPFQVILSRLSYIHLSGWQEHTMTLEGNNCLTLHLVCNNIFFSPNSGSNMGFVGLLFLVHPSRIINIFMFKKNF